MRARHQLTVVILSALLAVSGPLAAQRFGVQEIGRSDLEIEHSSRLPPQAAAALAEAGNLYADGDSEGAIPLLQSVIETLAPLAAATGDARKLAGNDPRLFETLRTAWLYLAAAHWTLSDRDAADEALDRIVRLDPLFELDEETAGKQLTDRLEGRREELVGRVSFLVLPRDARILVGDIEFENATPPETPPGEEDGEAAEDGSGEEAPADAADNSTASDPDVDTAPEPEPFEPSEPSPLLAGDYLAFVSRPGFLPTTAAFAVAGGRDLEVEVELLLQRLGVGVAADGDITREQGLSTLDDVQVDDAGTGIRQHLDLAVVDAVVELIGVLKREGVHVQDDGHASCLFDH